MEYVAVIDGEERRVSLDHLAYPPAGGDKALAVVTVQDGPGSGRVLVLSVDALKPSGSVGVEVEQIRDAV